MKFQFFHYMNETDEFTFFTAAKSAKDILPRGEQQCKNTFS